MRPSLGWLNQPLRLRKRLKMPYTKPWKSYEEQLDILVDRGLQVADHGKALEHLEHIGYYRLSGYWFPFRERSGLLTLLDNQGKKPKKYQRVETIALETFEHGATFEKAVALYEFDKQLRLLALEALEPIEIALRVEISHILGQLDKFAYLKPECLHEDFTQKLSKDRGVSAHHDWLGKQAQLISRSKEEFVRHHKTQYGLPLVIWVACEVWDFGTLSKLFSGMREKEQDTIASRYGIKNGRIFANWLRSLNFLRNVCAHHGRLWNRNITELPKLPPASSEMEWVAPFAPGNRAHARCYLLLCMAQHILQTIEPTSAWPQQMKDHLQSFPDLKGLGVSLTDIGVVEDREL